MSGCFFTVSCWHGCSRLQTAGHSWPGVQHVAQSLSSESIHQERQNVFMAEFPMAVAGSCRSEVGQDSHAHQGFRKLSFGARESRGVV